MRRIQSTTLEISTWFIAWVLFGFHPLCAICVLQYCYLKSRVLLYGAFKAPVVRLKISDLFHSYSKWLHSIAFYKKNITNLAPRHSITGQWKLYNKVWLRSKCIRHNMSVFDKEPNGSHFDWPKPNLRTSSSNQDESALYKEQIRTIARVKRGERQKRDCISFNLID